MTFKEIAEMIEDIGLPFTYYSFPEGAAPLLPYIVYYYPGTNNIPADNKVYVINQTLNIELYTRTKDFDQEAAVEAVLEANGLVWDKSETYINEEHMFEVLYEMEVIIHGE